MDSDLKAAMAISASGMEAQSTRMRVVSENLANANSVASSPEEAPYRRKIVTFETALNEKLGAETVQVDSVERAGSDFGRRYEPGHPGANAEGYVRTTNVQSVMEAMDMTQARRSYEANLNVMDAVKRMASRTVSLLR